MDTLSQFFSESNQIPLKGEARSFKAKSLSFSKYIHTFDAQAFHDNSGAPFHRNLIFKAAFSRSAQEFESLNRVQGGSFGFFFIADSRENIEKLFEASRALFLGELKSQLFDYLSEAFGGYGLEMGIIHTESPETSFLKILGDQFGPTGFMGRFFDLLSRKHGHLLADSNVRCGDCEFFEYYGYCDTVFEDQFGPEHTLELFKTIAKDPELSGLFKLPERDPERYAMLLSQCEQKAFESIAPPTAGKNHRHGL